MHQLKSDWSDILEPEFTKSYFKILEDKIRSEYHQYSIHPSYDDIFAAFESTPYAEAKVVILGQDPYHGHDQAHGFSFSVRPDKALPPSLRNIYKELEEDLGIGSPGHGDLRSWAAQGVLLLNDVLTVREGEANSHRGLGWERFTDAAVHALNERETPLVFFLWGRHAQKKGDMIDRGKHLVITSPHPSPLAAHRGFFGSRPFSQANAFLEENRIEPVDWSLPLKNGRQ